MSLFPTCPPPIVYLGRWPRNITRCRTRPTTLYISTYTYTYLHTYSGSNHFRRVGSATLRCSLTAALLHILHTRYITHRQPKKNVHNLYRTQLCMEMMLYLHRRPYALPCPTCSPVPVQDKRQGCSTLWAPSRLASGRPRPHVSGPKPDQFEHELPGDTLHTTCRYIQTDRQTDMP